MPVSFSRAEVWAFPHFWPGGPLTHCKSEIRGPHFPKTSVSNHSLLVMGQGLGNGFTAQVVTTPNEIGPMTGKMWVLESEGLGANPSSAISQLCGLVSKAPRLLMRWKQQYLLDQIHRVIAALSSRVATVWCYCVTCGTCPCSI